MRKEFSWRIKEEADKAIRVVCEGSLTEQAALEQLPADAARVDFDVAKVQRFNSAGLVQWMNFVNALPPRAEVRFHGCSVGFVHQLNLVLNFVGHGRVVSLRAPYVCVACDIEYEKLVDIESVFPDGWEGKAPEFSCVDCDGPLDFDGDADEFFSFLNR